MKIERDWKEDWIDRMGLIVTLSGVNRFISINAFKHDMEINLSAEKRSELSKAIRQRFTPSNGEDGCKSAMKSVQEATA